MSTVPGMFSDREVEAEFAPSGFTRVGTGHYRRVGPEVDAAERMLEHMRTLEPPPPPPLASHLEVIAGQIRNMPYGDVVDMAEGCGIDPQKLWDWAVGLK